MKKNLPLLLLLIAWFGCSTCYAEEGDDALKRHWVKAVLSWLDCDECFEHEFDYLISLGPRVKPILEAARDQNPPFDDIISERRSAYREGGRRVATVRLGIEGATRVPDEMRSLDDFARKYADYFVQGDIDRFTRKARKALRNLPRRRREG